MRDPLPKNRQFFNSKLSQHIKHCYHSQFILLPLLLVGEFLDMPVGSEAASSFTRSAYLKVFSECSQELIPGEIIAIMQVLDLSPMKESLSTCVSLLARKGRWAPRLPKALNGQ